MIISWNGNLPKFVPKLFCNVNKSIFGWAKKWNSFSHHLNITQLLSHSPYFSLFMLLFLIKQTINKFSVCSRRKNASFHVRFIKMYQIYLILPMIVDWYVSIKLFHTRNMKISMKGLNNQYAIHYIYLQKNPMYRTYSYNCK